MDKADYIKRAAAVYKQSVADCTEEFAIQCAEGCYENRDVGDDNSPEDDARDDLSYWDDDGA